ncbi:hypothetical protein HMPREF3156_00422 [Neisseria sp. HMSC06F02]|nr:hypothetical protein HMPREF3156_00422 [Neisseria sp. HMSC06F02]
MYSDSYQIAQQALNAKNNNVHIRQLTLPLGNARPSEIPRTARNAT